MCFIKIFLKSDETGNVKLYYCQLLKWFDRKKQKKSTYIKHKIKIKKRLKSSAYI